MDTLKTAGHIAGVRISALTGDQEGVRRNLDAMSEDMRVAMKLPDAGRPIDREAARTIALAHPGVRSAVWVDRSNLLVRVDGAHLRSYKIIDELCYRLESLGDTLAVVVHLQNAAARTRDDMDSLSRNCQLAPGDRAMLQRDRRLDVLDPAVRAQHRAETKRLGRQPTPQHSEGDSAALEAIPEM